MEDESNNAGDGSDSFIVDSIAEIIEELPEVQETTNKVPEIELLPNPSVLRKLKRDGKLPPNLAPEIVTLMYLDDEDAKVLLDMDNPKQVLRELYLEGIKASADDTVDNDVPEDEDPVNDGDPEEKMKQILLKEKTSELRRLRSEGLLPKLRPKIEALLNEYIDLGDTDSDDDPGSEDNEIPEALDPNLSLPVERCVFGFKEDCFILLSKFSASKDRSFKGFAKVWREMKFSGVFRQHELLDYNDLKLIFGCTDSDDDEDYEEEDDHKVDGKKILTQRILDQEDEHELRMKYIVDAVLEVFLIAKIFMLPQYPKSFRKGAFFLLYSVYYRQPFKTDDTLKIGEFAISFDLTELCLFKQIYEGETEEGKYELRQLYDRLMEDGGIEIKTTFHDPTTHVNVDNELKAWYYMKLIQERGAIELVDKEWKHAFADYTNSFGDGSDIQFHETLWNFMGKYNDDHSPFKFEPSPIPKFFDDDEGPGFSVLQGDTRSVKDYLNEIPDIIPDPDPPIICLDGSQPPAPATSIMEVDLPTWHSPKPSTSKSKRGTKRRRRIPPVKVKPPFSLH